MDRTDTSTSQSAVGTAHIVSSESEFEHLLSTSDRLLVDFYAEWCGPCQAMAPIIDELSATTDATVVKVNIESLPLLVERYSIRSVPTVITFTDGTERERLVGHQDRATLADALR